MIEQKKSPSCLFLLIAPVYFFIFVVVVLSLSSCGSPGLPQPNTPRVEETAVPTPNVVSTQSNVVVPPVVIPQPDRYNFLLLGGDYRSHRTTNGDKTDVMLLVSILMEDPVRITVVQFPRNLYVPVEAMEDQWLFHVYSREGFVGLHYYYQEVFGVDLHGIAYINMDNFVTLVDGLGGIWEGGTAIGSEVLDGAETLVFLRDNTNNWGCHVYDCGNRQFKVLVALAEKIKTRFHENALVTAKDLWGAYGNLLETDLSEFEQIHYIAELAWTIATRKYIVDFTRLAEPTVIRGETPLEVRGLVPNQNLKLWMNAVLGK